MASRSAWRLPFVHPLFFSKAFSGKRAFKTANRWLSVPFLDSLGRSFYVYNGQKFLQVIYKKEMVGFKLGSFSITKDLGYKSKNIKKKQKRSR